MEKIFLNTVMWISDNRFWVMPLILTWAIVTLVKEITKDFKND